MKYLIFFLISCTTSLYAQVGIGTTTPNAQLEIQSSNQATPNNIDGLLIPKADEFPATAPTAAQDGMMLFATGLGSVAKGFYYWDQTTTSWINATGAKSINDLLDGQTYFTSLYLGSNAGFNNGGSFGNTGVGYRSLYENISGTSNTAIGTRTLHSNTANFNTAIGHSALENNTSGERNVALGYNSLQANISGSYNTAVGERALEDNTSGQQNVAIGVASLANNVSGEDNVGLGLGSLFTNISGDQNTAIGASAMLFNSIGHDNVALGHLALYSNTEGHHNTALGAFSLYRNTTGNQNTAIGADSLNENTTGDFNVGIGSNALSGNTSGNYNIGLGRNSMLQNTTGNRNVAIGRGSLEGNVTGSYNIALGYSSGSLTPNLSNNITLGYQAGNAETNSDRLYIENSSSATPLIYGEFDNDILGFNALVGIGNQAPQVPLHITGTGAAGSQDIVATLGSNISNRPILQFSETADAGLNDGMSLEYDGRGAGGANRLVMNNIGGNPLFEFRNSGSLTLNSGSLYVNHPNGSASQGLILVNTVDADAWRMYHQWNSNTLSLMFNNINVGNFDDVTGVYSAVSDRNLKTNIQPVASVLEKVKKLAVVDYQFIFQKDAQKHIGLIAQDVEKIFPHLVSPPNEEVANYTMDYSGFGVLAIKAIQEQEEKIASLKMMLQQQQKEIEAIKELLTSN